MEAGLEKTTETLSLRKVTTRRLGEIGEDLAAEYLMQHGYEIVARNWRNSRGEIDIIAENHQAIVAVEVKTRRGTGYGSPLEAITRTKAARLRKLLLAWLRSQGRSAPRIRIDAISITLFAGRRPLLEHLEGVA